eukprot:365612-Chlamydomonas_euryale.AAC.7
MAGVGACQEGGRMAATAAARRMVLAALYAQQRMTGLHGRRGVHAKRATAWQGRQRHDAWCWLHGVGSNAWQGCMAGVGCMPRGRPHGRVPVAAMQ